MQRYVIVDTSRSNLIIGLGEYAGDTLPQAAGDIVNVVPPDAEMQRLLNDMSAGYELNMVQYNGGSYRAYYNFTQDVIQIEIMPGGVPPIPSGREEREARDYLLLQSDWTQLPDTALAPSCVADFAAYRQALRDVPQQSGFPSSIVWPVRPAEIKPGGA